MILSKRIVLRKDFLQRILLFYRCKYSVHATWKIKSTINGSKNIKKNYSPEDKSLVGEGAGEEDVYKQYLGTLGGLTIWWSILKSKICKISHINNSSTAVLREFDFVDGEILIILCGLISVVTKYLIFMSFMSMKKKE